MSQAPPVLEKLKAIWMPETMIPVKSPSRHDLLKKRPVKNGAKITRAPGAIILLREALVEMATHLSESGFLSFFYMASNWLLISAIISLAASPTADMVRAEKAYGIIAPMMRPAKVVGSRMLTTKEVSPVF